MASQMLGHGVAVVTVSQRLGHARASTTLNVYGHCIPGADRDAAHFISNLIALLESARGRRSALAAASIGYGHFEAASAADEARTIGASYRTVSVALRRKCAGCRVSWVLAIRGVYWSTVGWRSSHAWSVSVVHVATPAPRKSLSFVQMSAERARAQATTGQSVGSRNVRVRASSCKAE